ncbi:MAG: hypothetical protein JXD22_09470 [Sedimentisphaerales bacterium]|nr:hypothetical protein [Sedimentisphaerales bacterium]
MSEQQMGRKEVERIELNYFTIAYKRFTGDELNGVSSYTQERPDFICTRSNGEHVGVELNRVMVDPKDSQWDSIIHYEYEQDPSDTLARLYAEIERKDKKRQDYGEWAEKTILVMQLFECSLSSLKFLLTDDLREDFTMYGFLEIWIGDYTVTEAYGEVELFGLFPGNYWEYFPVFKKPYG